MYPYLTQVITVVVLGGLIVCMWHSVNSHLRAIELRLVLDPHKKMTD